MRTSGWLVVPIVAILAVMTYFSLFGEKYSNTITFTYELRGVRYEKQHDERPWLRPHPRFNAQHYAYLHNSNAAASGGRAARVVDIQYCAYQQPCVSWMRDDLRI